MSRLSEAFDRVVGLPETRAPQAPSAGPARPIAGTINAVEREKSTIAPTVMSAPIERFEPAPDVASRLVTSATIPQAAVEQYRKLVATLGLGKRDMRVIMVSSAASGDGKTLTATNLALTLSESYRRRVLLVDADLRRPSLHVVLQIPNDSGLTDGLKAETTRHMEIVRLSPYLWVLPAGHPDSDPMSGLTSARMRRFVEEATELYDWVIIDTPPVGVLPDAKLLAAMADATLLVIGAGKTPYAFLKRALDALGRDRVLGVVLNRVDAKLMAGEYYYYGYGTVERK
jgi:protein-tyrosine kinase